VRVVVLIDNTSDHDTTLTSERGLSMYIEYERNRILLDTGLSGSFIDNAHSLGIDLTHLDFCFLSHGHNDHSGGLGRFLETIPNTPVYLSESICHERYFSSRHTFKRNLSIDGNLFQRFSGRFVPLKESRWIAPYIAAVCCRRQDYACPQGNVFLSKEKDGMEMPDDFSHEMSLAFKTTKGLIVFSSCSHHGAVNIMKSCEEFTGGHTITHYIGGLHFVDCNKTEEEVIKFNQVMHSEYAHTTLITGHCTSDKAKDFLKTSDLDIRFFHTGCEIII
jgi:7,8-dihydropterin-6-yl-methyl-4-(beta-D-ribofuranosyl)aminobenzene 5'-phosphate synthase